MLIGDGRRFSLSLQWGKIVLCWSESEWKAPVFSFELWAMRWRETSSFSRRSRLDSDRYTHVFIVYHYTPLCGEEFAQFWRGKVREVKKRERNKVKMIQPDMMNSEIYWRIESGGLWHALLWLLSWESESVSIDKANNIYSTEKVVNIFRWTTRWDFCENVPTLYFLMMLQLVCEIWFIASEYGKRKKAKKLADTPWN